MAAADTSVWVLRKRDFDQCLERSRTLAQAVQKFLQQEEVATYLQQKQEFDPNQAARWVRSAVSSMDTGKSIPSAAEMTEIIRFHRISW